LRELLRLCAGSKKADRHSSGIAHNALAVESVSTVTVGVASARVCVPLALWYYKGLFYKLQIR